MNIDKFLQAFKDLFNQFVDNLEFILPKALNAVIIIIVGIILAWIIKSILTRISRRLDQVKMKESFKGRINTLHLQKSAKLVIKAIYWLIIIIFLTVATELLGLPVITTWLSGLLKYFPNLLIAIILITLGVFGGKLIGDLIATAPATEAIIYRNFLGRFIQFSVVAISILIAVDQIGVDVSLIVNLIDILLAALLFGACFAFGLGAKTSVSNILASYYVQRTYRVGHYVKIEDIQGRIIQIKPNSVIVETKEGQVLIPAKKFSEVVSMLVKKD